MIWFTSDHHFGHANIIKFVNRPFESVEEMDEEMIRRWNEVVQESDTVYHLGDFTLGGSEVFWSYARKLNGNINIIPGGHDKRWLKGYDDKNPSVFPWLVMDDNILPKRGDYKMSITMCHYPLLSWEQSHYGAPHLHGHTHGTIGITSESGDKQLPPGQNNGVRIDLSVDNWNFYPISLGHVLDIAGLR